MIIAFKLSHTFFSDKEDQEDDANATTDQEVDKDMTTIYINGLEILLACFTIYGIRKIKLVPTQYWLYTFILCANGLLNINFWINPKNPLIEMQFLYTIALSHVLRA